jgi:hypothetical protein
MNDWTKTMDRRGQTDIIYLDFAKAFDTVSHQKLLIKLEAMGIKGYCLGWIRAFLSNRSQFVSVEGVSSAAAPVTSGVPQGCVCSPIYFLSYINDMLFNLSSSKAKLFADDAKIYIQNDSGRNTARLQTDLNEISRWSNTWQLNLSISKCNVLHAARHPHPSQYSIDNIPITGTEHAKDLGVYISRDLKFTHQCQKVASAALRASSCILRNFTVKNAEFLRQMFITFVRPQVEYATVVWSPWHKSDINLIERVQRSFTSKIPGIAGPYPTRLATLKLQRLELRRLIFDLTEAYKILHGHSPLKSNDFFQLSNSRTRGHALKLIKERVHCDERKFFFSNRVFNVWNSLPEDIVCAPTIAAFKRLITSNENIHEFLKGEF